MRHDSSLRVVIRHLLPPLLLLAPAIAHGAGSESVEIVSAGAALQARFYRAECEAACPTLLLVPGFPGSAQPDVLGLGARLSAEGLNVLVVNPRGLQQSEGTMTFFHTLDDIQAALDWLLGDSVGERFGVDNSAVVIGGHSFGGGTTMAYAASDPRVRAIVSVAGTDHGELIREYERDADFAEMVNQILRAARAPDGPARFDVSTTLGELAENQAVFGLRENAARLADRSILLIGGWEDGNVTMERSMVPLYRALKEAGAADVTFHAYQDDHGFGQVRDRLAEDLASWVRQVTATSVPDTSPAALPEAEDLESHKALARRWFEEVINQRDLDAIDDIYANDYVHHGPAGREMRKQQVRAFAAAILAASDDRQVVVHQQVVENDRVVTHFTSSGHHTGPFQGIAPTGEIWTTEGIVISRIEDGKIAEDWEIIHVSGL